MNNHILVIDDDEDERFLIKSSFEAAGDGTSLSFAEGPDGLANYVQETGAAPRVIILDPKALETKGLQFIREIRNSPILGTVPVIVYSAQNNPDHINECYQSGANSFIVKPSSFSGMVSVAQVIISYWLKTAALPKSN